MRERTSIITAMLFLLACATARGVAIVADDPPAAATGTVIGKVVDTNGNPAADVIVTIAPDGQKMRQPIDATTDSVGAFKIEKVPEGDYNLNARSRDAKFKVKKSLTITADHTTDVGTLKLKGK